MASAMDRVSKSPSRWRWVGLGLALVATDLGCSRLKSHQRSAPPAVLGTQHTSRDVYADGHRARAASMPSEDLPAGTEVVDAPTVQGNEVGMAIRPAEPSTLGVALRPPVPVEVPAPVATPAAARLAPTTTGVPNAGLMLASAERRAVATPAVAAPAPIVAQARAALDRMATYQVSMHRQERVNGTLQPEEDVVLAVRREPRAVRLSWPSGPSQGREVLYRADEPGGLMHVHMASSPLPIPRLSIPPDSPMVMRSSRHPVTEAGFDPIVRALEEALHAPGGERLAYAGLEAPAPLDHPHHCLARFTAQGEMARVYIDPATHLPALIAIDASNGEMLERYVFRDVRPNPPELATADAFDPDARWGPPRGLLGRIARANPAQPGPVAGSTPP